MAKITAIAKKLLDADTQALIKAGYLDSELELTEEGYNVLEAILFEQNKSALVASAKEKNECAEKKCA